MLQQQLQSIFQGGMSFPPFPGNGGGFGNGNMGNNSDSSSFGTAVFADSYSVAPGGALHFTGEGFSPNETIAITANGTTLGHAQADGSGHFSVDGNAANTEGDTTFWFTGQNSGDRDSVMITVDTGDNS
jgi:hypothetical protein